MFINLCVINVGASVGNRALVCEVFSYVDVLFFVDPPAGPRGEYVDGDVGDFVFVCGKDDCDVHVFIRKSLLGMFDIIHLDSFGVILSMVCNGVRFDVGGLYLRPGMSAVGIEEALMPYLGCHMLVGDMNARHDRWGHVADVGGHNSQGGTVARVLADFDFMVPTVATFDDVSVIDLCAFKRSPRKYRLSHRAGLQHAAQIIKLAADHDRLPPPMPNYKLAKWDMIEDSLKAITDVDQGTWDKARAVVDSIPRKSHGRDRCRWWNDDLERMRSDVRRLRRISIGDRNRREDCILARKIYRAAMIQARYDNMCTMLASAKDPDIFRFVNRSETSRNIPPMDCGDGTFRTSHEDISDLIAAQLDPVPPSVWVPGDGRVWDTVGQHVDEALAMSPGNTATSYEGMSYPFIRFWARKARLSFVRCLEDAVRFGNEDWHLGEVVLIRKADKPRYDVVKGWRMIHLLPVMAKVVERMVLLEVVKHVELEQTQFGSRRKRGTHDSCALIYEFLKAHEGYCTALLSMDVEGGFDRINMDLLADFLSARGCPIDLVLWIRHWATQRRIQFRFNGRISREYTLSKGIPQGSPLSPFLFGVYVADIFRPRLQVSPSCRSMVGSYVDDGLIGVAGDSVRMVKNRLEEVFRGCVETAEGRGMGFSGLKTKWIGFGQHDWGMLELNGVEVENEDDLRVLGMRFAKDGKMGRHVDYWLKRGLGVRARIGALGRRFGGFGGLGAWEIMRLVQGAYLPTVEYGLEFVMDDPVAVRKIDVHVRDCLRSLFRMPMRLANNILHSECGIPPTHIRGTYIRSRCAQRFLNYGYCSSFPWHGSVRNAWCLPGMAAVRMTSLEVMSGTQTYTIAPDKETARVEGLNLIDTLAAGSDMVGFVDGSNKGTGCGCAWVAYVGLVQMRSGSCGLPADWDIDSCELFAILSLLRDILALSPRFVTIFTDSQTAIRMISGASNSGTTSGIWEAFTPLLSRIDRVALRWIPGHVGILSNEIVDRLAKRACGLRLEPARWAYVDFGTGAFAAIRKARLVQWRSWHLNEGHAYYGGVPHDFRHLRGLSRLDLFALIRIRSGTGLVGHDDCRNKDDRHHWVECDRYLDNRPPRSTLFDNNKVAAWVKWFKHHDMLGLGIPSNVRSCGWVSVAFGNPFDGTACIVRDGRRIVVDIVAPTYRCERCNLVHSSAGCSLPAINLSSKYYFLSVDQEGSESCPVCLTRLNHRQDRSRHFDRYGDCLIKGELWFWHGVKLLWDRFGAAEKVKLAVKWLYRKHTKDVVACLGCRAQFSGSSKWLSHLRMESNDGCWPALWLRFITDCDAVGDDERDKLLVLRVLGMEV